MGLVYNQQENQEAISMKNMGDMMINPIRMRILQLAITNKQITTSRLAEQMPDVSRTTLYRYVKELIDSNILIVVEEHKVRGKMERTLAPGMEWWNQENTIEKADDNFYQMLMGLYGKCHDYFTGDDANPVRDKIFLNHMILMLSDSEMDDFVKEIKEVFEKYDNRTGAGRKVRDLTLLSAPNKKID
jgi:predicted transcriptional regulator